MGGKEGEQRWESTARYKGGRDAARRGGKEAAAGGRRGMRGFPDAFLGSAVRVQL